MYLDSLVNQPFWFSCVLDFRIILGFRIIFLVSESFLVAESSVLVSESSGFGCRIILGFRIIPQPGFMVDMAIEFSFQSCVGPCRDVWGVRTCCRCHWNLECVVTNIPQLHAFTCAFIPPSEEMNANDIK